MAHKHQRPETRGVLTLSHQSSKRCSRPARKQHSPEGQITPEKLCDDHDHPPTLWGIHAGKTGDAASLFLKKNCVALGWVKMPDLASLSPDREAFKEAVTTAYPDKKPGAIPNNAGQLFRFVHEMEIGDLVTLGKYSRQCRNFEQGKGNLRIIEGDELVDLIFQHYETFDTRYKILLPLKRIYVPEIVSDSDEG